MPNSTMAPPHTVPPLTEPIAIALGRLVDDHGGPPRQPAHWDVTHAIERAGLAKVDPGKQQMKPVGKYKRVQQVLLWAVEYDMLAGQRLVSFLVSAVRGCGGFRTGVNYAGAEAINNLSAVFKTEGWLLTDDGELHRHLLDDDELGTKSAGDVLAVYARRANQGAEDAALVTSTGKDLVEAVAAHVLVKQFSTYSLMSFPQLLGMAFTTLGLEATKASTPQSKIEQGLYSTACAVNQLRNKQGTGHGRPFLPTVTVEQARIAIRSMGVVADLLLSKLNEQAS